MRHLFFFFSSFNSSYYWWSNSSEKCTTYDFISTSKTNRKWRRNEGQHAQTCMRFMRARICVLKCGSSACSCVSLRKIENREFFFFFFYQITFLSTIITHCYSHWASVIAFYFSKMKEGKKMCRWFQKYRISLVRSSSFQTTIMNSVNGAILFCQVYGAYIHTSLTIMVILKTHWV